MRQRSSFRLARAARLSYFAAFFVILAAMLASRNARAFEWESELRLQMNDGGDKIGSVKYSDGSISDLKTGTYFTLGAGFAVIPWRMDIHALELGTRLGFATWSTGPDNTDDRLKLTRFPWELLAFYRLDFPNSPISLRVGGGMVYHFVSGVSGSGSLSNINLDIDNGLGWTAEIHAVYQLLALGFGFTGMHYDVSGTNVRLDASSFGGSLSVVFPPIRPAPSPAPTRSARLGGAAGR